MINTVTARDKGVLYSYTYIYIFETLTESSPTIPKEISKIYHWKGNTFDFKYKFFCTSFLNQ